MEGHESRDDEGVATMAVKLVDYTETVEEIDQETIDARIDILLEAWTYTAEDLESEDDDMQASVQNARQRAYVLAATFPSNIADDLFAEYVAEGLVA